MVAHGIPERVRIDKWLWAARFYKTRSAATAAVAGGKVDVNGETAKPARSVIPGDRIALRVSPFEYDLTVTGLAERRGTVAQAALLYQESEGSRMARERLAQQLRDAPQVVFDEGRPSKRDRRVINKLRGRN